MKRGVLLFVVLILVSSLAARQAQAYDGAKGPVSFYVFGDDAEKAAYDTLVAAFSKKFPDIQVKLVSTPGEDEFKFGDAEDAYRQRLTLDFASSKPPDVFLMNYREYGIFAGKNAIEPVGPYFTKSTVLKAGDFYQEALTPFMRNGTLDCVPQGASSIVVYYNKDLFDKAKVAYPKAGWTWDDFLKTAQALTVAGDEKTAQFGLVIEKDFTRVMPFIWQNGGEIVDNAAKPTKLTLDTPEAKAAFQFFVDLQVKYHVTPNEEQATSQSIEDRFLTGKAGMIVFSRRLVPSLRQTSFDWDVAPLPQGKKAATLLYSDGYCMSKGGQNKDAAWALIEYANSVEGQTILAKTGRTVPSLKAVANSPAFLDPSAKPKNSQIFLDEIPNIRTSPILVNWADIEEQANQQLDTAFYGGQTVDKAVAAIQDNTKDLFGK